MAAPKKPTGTVLRCTVQGGFHTQGPKDEAPYYIAEGELVRATHPAVKANPQFFAPVDDFDRPEVEQATASPGEKRGAK